MKMVHPPLIPPIEGGTTPSPLAGEGGGEGNYAMKQGLKEELLGHGAMVVGFAGLRGHMSGELAHLDKAVSIGVDRKLNEDTLSLLMKLQKRAVRYLKSRGYRTLAIPPDSDRKMGKMISKLYKLFCHKTAATCSGLGWIGKNGLIINEQYGSKMTWATVLTDAPLGTDRPYVASQCGECDLCVKHCPSGAVKGHLWTLGNPLREIVVYEKCRALKSGRTSLKEKPNCGFCVTVCPYSRNGGKHKVA